MKKLALSIVSFLFLNYLFAQTPNLLWAKQMGSSSGEAGVAIAVDMNGSTYNTGYFKGTTDFDPGPGTYNLTCASAYDIFISKLDSYGNFIWAKQIGGQNTSFGSEGISISVDYNGNVYLTGYFQGTSDFDPGSGIYNMISTGDRDIYISKLNSSGDFIWAKQMGGTNIEVGYCITVDANGNVYTTGNFTSTADFDPGLGTYNLTSAGGNDIFISKLNAFGNLIWAKKLGGTSDEYGLSIAADTNGNIYTTGFFNGMVDFDPGTGTYNLTSSGSSDIYISKLDASGNFIWAKRMGGTNYDMGNDIAVYGNGSIYLTGRFNGNADFDPGAGTYNLTSAGGNDIFVSKLDTSGNFMWAKRMGGSNDNEIGTAIAVDMNGSVYTTGYFAGTADFDPGAGIYNLSSNGSWDIYISRLDASGNFVWANQIGSIVPDRGNDIAVDANGNVCIIGLFSSIADFDPGPWTYNLTPSNGGDIFVVKLSGDPTQFTEPKITISKSVLDVGDTQYITGKDFSINGKVNLIVKNAIGESLQTTNSIIYLPNGNFSYQLPITLTMPEGEYKVYAIDSLSGQITSPTKFLVSNPTMRNLWIKEPINLGIYEVSKPIKISWGDFVTKSNVTGASGFVQKRYKIEYSNNNGSSWIIIESEKSCNNLRSNQDNICSISPYTFLQPGNYQIKVTDLDNPANFNISSFIIGTNSSNGFTTTLEWDQSIPHRNDNPVGLAADGTSRVIIKLNKAVTNIKLVKKISAHIETDGGISLTGIDMLGKLKPAKTFLTYSEEGNSANTITADTTFNTPYADNMFQFWLVAPDNFTEEPLNQDAERTIKIIFDITYSDNSIEQIQVNKIRIVRPPLMMVHGLNGSPESFDKMKYDLGGIIRYFKYAGGTDGLFKNLKRVNLKNYAAFKTNAEILLGIGDIAYRLNSFQRTLKEFHDLGFAANKVDYVCHSMGGNIARTIINQYDNYYRPTVQNTSLIYKNYSKGFINKLITINTPHNGSPVADFIDDCLGTGFTTFSFIESRDNLGGFFTKRSSDNIFSYYEPSPAIKDLRAINGGIRFNTTNVKNHLIGGDVDRYNIPDALVAVMVNDPSSYLDYMEMMGVLVPGSFSAGVFSNVLLGLDAIANSLNAFISLKYGYGNFLSNSDVIVPVSSQFAGRDQNSIPELEDNLSTIDNATIGYGLERNHNQITDNVAVGNTVMRLLNSKINSGYFSNQIPANNMPGGMAYRETNTTSIQDSILYYTDTSFIQIMSPSIYDQVLVDSAIDINLFIKDTVNLKKIRLFFQGQLYHSNSHTFIQRFNIKANSNSIGKSVLAVDAIYDSLGYTIYHTDTATIIATSLNILQGIYLTPKTQNLNKEHIFNLKVNGIYNSYIGALQNNIDSLVYTISDTNVVRFDSSAFQFISKDTGTAYIVYNYKGYTDTAFIYISIPPEENIVNGCTHGSISFFAGIDDPTKNYQWQVDTSNGFENILPSSIYTGINNSTLVLNNAPSSWYDYKYRCLISDGVGQSMSEEFKLKFTITWTGAVDTAWENVANWNCNTIPDENTDVIIGIPISFNPVINNPATCRSLNLKMGGSLKANNNLVIVGNNL